MNVSDFDFELPEELIHVLVDSMGALGDVVGGGAHASNVGWEDANVKRELYPPTGGAESMTFHRA